ncbi:MAG: AraC family transcriptional regulator ligand-binding domain-containing protein [Gammaproteobacteria bacterium]|nr:AraC family transcriptional regulator ligand-binding domain-containing protein [Gammaproteobacteria bacterium]
MTKPPQFVPADRLATTLIANTYVRLLAQEFDDHATLAAGTGIAPAELAHYPHPVTVSQHLRCIGNALPLRTTPDWHLKWGKRMAENFHGAVTLAWLTAPTLGDGLDAFIKYMPSRIPYLEWRGRHDAAQFRCEVTPRMDLGLVLQTAIEIPIMVMHEYVRVVRNGPATAARIEFAHAAPPYRERYATWFDCPVSFERGGNALIIPAEWRAEINVDFDEGAWQTALVRCEAALRSTDTADVATRVARLLEDLLAQPAPAALPSLEAVAQRLHLSSRTIIRHLRAQGTTYQALLDAVLKVRAQSLLGEPGMRVQDIAARLGYADSASFRKAFRRWFGMTPAAWRQGGA